MEEETTCELRSRLKEVMQSVLFGYTDFVEACERSLLESIKEYCRRHGGNVEECTKAVKAACVGYSERMSHSLQIFRDAVEETLKEIPPPIAATTEESACPPEEEKLLLDEIKELEREIRKNQDSIQESLQQSKELRWDEMLLEKVQGCLAERMEALLDVELGQQAREALALQRNTESLLKEIDENVFSALETATGIQKENTQQKTKDYLRLAKKL